MASFETAQAGKKQEEGLRRHKGPSKSKQSETDKESIALWAQTGRRYSEKRISNDMEEIPLPLPPVDPEAEGPVNSRIRETFNMEENHESPPLIRSRIRFYILKIICPACFCLLVLGIGINLVGRISSIANYFQAQSNNTDITNLTNTD